MKWLRFLYSLTGLGNWSAGGGHAAAWSGRGQKYASSGVRSVKLEWERRLL